LTYFQHIQGFYGDKEVHYLPHPREDKEALLSLAKQTQVQMIKTDLSVEQYLMSLNVAPGILSGFFSAALWYVAKFQTGIQVEAHRLDPGDFVLKQSQLMSRSSSLSLFDIVELVYNYYRLRMKVVDAFS
jgi:hypothetical protein